MEEGFEKGMAMGIEKGKNIKETAMKMKKYGFPIEQIELISGLCKEQIEKL